MGLGEAGILGSVVGRARTDLQRGWSRCSETGEGHFRFQSGLHDLYWIRIQRDVHGSLRGDAVVLRVLGFD